MEMHLIKGPSLFLVGAGIGSFGGEVEIPWKRDLSLDCLAVGLPEPSVEWTLKGGPLHSGGKREVKCFST